MAGTDNQPSGQTEGISVNGERRANGSGSSLGTIVDGLGRGRSGIVVAVNEVVIPRSLWDSKTIQSGDRIEVLEAAQGG